MKTKHSIADVNDDILDIILSKIARMCVPSMRRLTMTCKRLRAVGEKWVASFQPTGDDIGRLVLRHGSLYALVRPGKWKGEDTVVLMLYQLPLRPHFDCPENLLDYVNVPRYEQAAEKFEDAVLKYWQGGGGLFVNMVFNVFVGGFEDVEDEYVPVAYAHRSSNGKWSLREDHNCNKHDSEVDFNPFQTYDYYECRNVIPLCQTSGRLVPLIHDKKDETLLEAFRDHDLILQDCSQLGNVPLNIIALFRTYDNVTVYEHPSIRPARDCHPIASTRIVRIYMPSKSNNYQGDMERELESLNDASRSSDSFIPPKQATLHDYDSVYDD